MGLLDGKVAIVTGAGGGIGREEALQLAAAGAKVVVNDLGGSRDGSGKSTQMADQVVDEIKESGGEAVPNYDSVADHEGGKNIVKTALDSFGGLDIVVNNAGILRDKTLSKMEEAEWDIVVAVHLKGTFNVTQPAFKAMKDAGKGGSIINTSSTSGLIGNFGQSNYGAAKAGIAGFTRVMALEGKKYGIRVNGLVPVALTRLTDDLPMMKGMGKALPPKHVAPVVVYLASDLAKDISGKFLGSQGKMINSYAVKSSKGVTTKEDMWTPEAIHDNIKEILNV